MTTPQAPKVFGREMIHWINFGSRSVYKLDVGIFGFDCTTEDGKIVKAGVFSRNVNPSDIERLDGPDALSLVESTARRIMRECFEIAGEMVAKERLHSGEYFITPVRFVDG